MARQTDKQMGKFTENFAMKAIVIVGFERA